MIGPAGSAKPLQLKKSEFGDRYYKHLISHEGIPAHHGRNNVLPLGLDMGWEWGGPILRGVLNDFQDIPVTLLSLVLHAKAGIQ
jgi:hypothetical protein